jgi:hypothetical protein
MQAPAIRMEAEMFGAWDRLPNASVIAPAGGP